MHFLNILTFNMLRYKLVEDNLKFDMNNYGEIFYSTIEDTGRLEDVHYNTVPRHSNAAVRNNTCASKCGTL